LGSFKEPWQGTQLEHALSPTLCALTLLHVLWEFRVMVLAGLHAIIVVCWARGALLLQLMLCGNVFEASSCMLPWLCMVIHPCVLSQEQESCTMLPWLLHALPFVGASVLITMHWSAWIGFRLPNLDKNGSFLYWSVLVASAPAFGSFCADAA
jgi:hypothetical protein